MNTSLDGSWALDRQTLAVQNAEAARHALTEITPDKDNAPWNTAVLRPLTPAEPRPAPLTIAIGRAPRGRTVVWKGDMFVEGKIVAAVAFR